MKTQWIVSVLSILVSMGLLVIIMGQYQVILLMKTGELKLKKDAQRLDNKYINEDLLKTTMEKLVVQGQMVAKELETSMEKLTREMEKKKTESFACQTEKKAIDDELAGKEKEITDSEASCKAEADVWTRETNALKEQLNSYREICDYVKKDPMALKLCGPKPS